MDAIEEKWRMWFDSLDVDKTGVLTPKTWTDAADIIIDGHSLTGSDADKAREKMAKLGEAVTGGSQSTITRDQFTENLATFFQKDKQQAEQYITTILRNLFEVMDTNNDSLVDEGSFVLMCRAFGHSEDTARAVFKVISGGKGEMTIDLCVEFWREVWFSANEEKWKTITDAIKM